MSNYPDDFTDTNMNASEEGEATHTPGPWHHSVELSRNVNQLVYGPDKYLICNVGAFKRADDENEANARLIASAPEMLKELKAIGHQTQITTGHYNRIQSLINKIGAGYETDD